MSMHYSFYSWRSTARTACR